jgi:hypothetical protein
MRNYLTKKVDSKSTKNSSNRGMSTVELLIAAGLTTVVVAAAGFGVSSMIASSNASSARSDRRAELNRSLDFISSEIRESTSLEKDVAAATTPAAFAPATGSSGARKVLMVNTAATGSTPVIYYVATPPAGTWKGPRVVYRWGPAFNANGNYTNAATPASWVSEVLIDNISNVNAASVAIGAPAPTCDNGGTYNGDSAFNACVDGAGRTAVIRQDGNIAKVLGASENYTASTNTGARRIASQGPTPVPLPSGALTANLQPSCPPTSIFCANGGEVVVPTAKTITVTTLPGDGYPAATSVRVAKGTNKLDFTPAYFTSNSTLMSIPKSTTTPQSMTVSVAAGEMISIAGCSNGTGGMTGSFYTSNISYCPISTEHQGNTVFTLKQGDFIPAVAGAYSNGVQQPSLRKILTGSDTIANVPAYSASGYGLKANELYYLYEIYTTDTSSTYRDLQDIVVKVTFN